MLEVNYEEEYIYDYAAVSGVLAALTEMFYSQEKGGGECVYWR